jgi:hypothetical protein
MAGLPPVMGSAKGQPPRCPPRGEPHRIYWQQWIANGNTSDEPKLSRRELITSSAAVRMTSSATIADITSLLRQTMELHDKAYDDDSIVLVGTLHSTSDRLVQFDRRFVEESSASSAIAASASSEASSSEQPRTKPFHVVQTLRGEARPLKAREDMLKYLESILARDAMNKNREPTSSSLPSSSFSLSTSVITPKLQFFYIPSPQLEATPVLIPNCVELDGYATDIDDDEDEDVEDDVPGSIKNPDEHDAAVKDNSVVSVFDAAEENEFRPIEETFPWLVVAPEDVVDNNDRAKTTTLVDRAKEYHTNLADELQQLSKSHTGFVLQCDRHDPYVWRTVWCALTADYLWTVSRLRRHHHHSRGEDDYYPHIQRLPLSRALLLQPSSDYPPLFKTPYSWEIVADDGTTHLFRANSRSRQYGWLEKISEAILAAYETWLFNQAETFVVDDCIARSHRCNLLAVEPIANAIDGPMKHNVLLLGMAVANYHEHFRRQPIVVATWALASSLRRQAALLVDLYGKDRSRLRTLCKHLDFVMSGRRQRSSGYLDEVAAKAENRTMTTTTTTIQEGIPPMDLFDAILVELQHLCCSQS